MQEQQRRRGGGSSSGKTMSSDVEAKISIYFRCPEPDKPEYTINMRGKEYVVPITWEALRLATKLHVEALMRYPVRPISTE